MLPHTQQRMLASPPYSLDINPHSQIPNPLLGSDRVRVIGVHDPGVVEHDVYAAPGVQVRDRGGNVGFPADVTAEGVD